MRKVKTFEKFVNEDCSINEASRWKGKEIYPNWVKPKDIGGFIKGESDLEVGSQYVLLDLGMNVWQAEYEYIGKVGPMHQFKVTDQFAGGTEPIEYSDEDLKDAIKDKEIASMNESVNEARTNFDVTVEEPFDKKREEMMAIGYKLKIDPITITGVNGTISDDITDVTIQFSNGDQLGYFNHSAPASRGNRELTLTKSDNSGFEKHLDNELDLYLGSSSSVIGDLCLIYRDYIQGKIK